ncbi:MAG TPA: hypothetical protein VFV38_52440, partial [Ktedonobacteraceae bacterium]|nr:hypothetical protein [Ktedonobacteraceae bacterium]
MPENDSAGQRMNLCGPRLCALRQSRQLSLADVQEALLRVGGLALTSADLVLIEKGTRPVSDVEVAAFAHFFQVAPAFLLWGELPPNHTQLRTMIQELALPDGWHRIHCQ